MATKTIMNPHEWREGDTATVDYKGHEATGKLWNRGDRSLFLGPVLIRTGTGLSPRLGQVTVTREVPDLPTKAGSVIILDSGRVLALVRGRYIGEKSFWQSLKGSAYSIEEIESHNWTLAKVVPA